MIVILRANDIITDPRVSKYVNYFNEHGIRYKILGWDRRDILNNTNNIIYYKGKAGYNIGTKAIFNRIFWNLYLIKMLYKLRKEYNVIHACDFDTIMPALIFKVFRKTVIFDIFDMFSYTIKTNKTIHKIIEIAENLAANISDYVIICEEERVQQFSKSFKNRNLLIFPNIPSEIDSRTSNVIIDSRVLDYDILKLTYIGTFYKDRFIEEIVSAVSELSFVELHIAGYGDPQIEEYIRNYSEKCENIIYYGKVTYAEGLEIMSKSNLLLAFYCIANKNHRFAAPNKYYESLMLGIPLLTNTGTILEDRVNRFKTGFTIGENILDFKTELEYIWKNTELLKEYSHNCKQLWTEKYSTFVRIFLNEKYISIITKRSNGT